MNIKFLEKKIKEKDKNFFDLKKFKIKPELFMSI